MPCEEREPIELREVADEEASSEGGEYKDCTPAGSDEDRALLELGIAVEVGWVWTAVAEDMDVAAPEVKD